MTKIDYKKEIKLGSIISYLTIFLNIVLGLIYTPWILKIIGPSDYGLYTLASSFIALFLLDFGMSASVTRFVSNYRTQNRQDCIDSFFGLALKFYLSICFIAAITLTIIYFYIPSIYISLTSVELTKFKIIFIITSIFIIFCFPVNLYNGILNAYEKYIILKSIDIFHKIGLVIVTIAILFYNPSVYNLVIVIGIFSLISFIIKIIVVRMKTPVRLSLKKNKEISIFEVFSFSFWTTTHVISNQLVTNLIPTILGMFSNTSAITLYGFANIMEGYVYTISLGINGLFLPSVSRTIANESNANKIVPLMKKVGRINLSIVMIIIIGFLLLGKEFILLWIGDEYYILYYCILLLIIHYIILSPQQIAQTSISVLNKIKYTSLVNVICNIMALITIYFVAQKYSVLGICVIILINNLVKLFCYNIIYIKVLKINILSFFMDCHLKLLPSFLICIALSFVVIKLLTIFIFNNNVSWLTFFIKCICISIIYIICMWIFGWNKEEKIIFKSLIPKNGTKN